MGELYTIGVFAGLGVAIGVLAAALFAGIRAGVLICVAVAGAGGAGLGFALGGVEEAVAGAIGGAAGGWGAGMLVRGALTRGGARAATGLILGAVALLLALLALVPAVGYVLALLLPIVAARLRRVGGRRYAGLRILARD